jgi:hypothetical protein
MSEREWQPGSSDAANGSGRSEGGTSGDARTEETTPGRGATDDANNVEGVQGAQGGWMDQPERERGEERGEVF